MKDSETLTLAAAIVEDAYCKDAYAKDDQGIRVGVNDPRAVKFCMLGSVCRVVGSMHLADEIVDKWVTPLLSRYAPLDAFSGPSMAHAHLRVFTLTPRAWNDAPGTSNTDVAGKLRDGAKLAAEKGE
jgi:hypothetical protein